MATIRKYTAGGTAPDGVQVGDTGEKIGFLGATPVVQVASANQTALTDSTSGAVTDATLAAISGSGADADINANFAKTAELVNALRSALVDLGLVKGSA